MINLMFCPKAGFAQEGIFFALNLFAGKILLISWKSKKLKTKNEEILCCSDKILPVIKETQTHTFKPITSLHRNILDRISVVSVFTDWCTFIRIYVLLEIKGLRPFLLNCDYPKLCSPPLVPTALSKYSKC